MARVLLQVPPTARRGEIIEIRALIQHPMETGFRRNDDGQAIPVHIIRRFTCTYNGEEVFAADLHPTIAANPYLAFSLLLAAGMKGIEEGYDLPAEAEDDVWSLTDAERRAMGIEPLPASLSEAMSRHAGPRSAPAALAAATLAE